MKKIVIGALSISLIVVLLTGCGSNSLKTSGTQSMISKNTKTLNSINVSVYEMNSKKAQPKLAMVYYKENQLKSFENLFNHPLHQDITIKNGNINNIYMFDFGYSKNKKIVNTTTYIVLETKDNKYLIKKITTKKNLYNLVNNFEKYNQKQRITLLSTLGSQHWKQIKSIAFLMD